MQINGMLKKLTESDWSAVFLKMAEAYIVMQVNEELSVQLTSSDAISPSNTFATSSLTSLSIRKTEHFSAFVIFLASCMISFSRFVKSSTMQVRNINKMYTQKFQHHHTRNNFKNTLSKTRSLFESNFPAFDQKIACSNKSTCCS